MMAHPVTLAAASYPLTWMTTWAEVERKITQWVSDAAGQGGEILIFPEYGAMELAGLAGEDAKTDLSRATEAVAEHMPRLTALYTDLAARFDVYILGASGPVKTQAEGRDIWVNRAHMIAPNGKIHHQDKQIMTPWEVAPWGIQGHGPLTLFESRFGRVAVLICYDCEFPLLARRCLEAGADLILIPSCTETIAGYWRVRIGAMARALESQCATAMASLVGRFPVEAVEENHGAGGIFLPPDIGTPADGVLACGELDAPGWVIGRVDPAPLAHLRDHGGVRTRADWPQSVGGEVAPPNDAGVVIYDLT